MVTVQRWRFVVIAGILPLVIGRSFVPKPYGGVRFGIPYNDRSISSRAVSVSTRTTLRSLRGGDGDGDTENTPIDDDAERYSRQFYTLGVRAQTCIRSSTIYLDGPPTSGMVYECAKNLALSGVGSLVFLEEEEEKREGTREKDALGEAYRNAARAELGLEEGETTDMELLVEYTRRLNPGVSVSVGSRTLLEQQHRPESDEFIPPAKCLLVMERPESTQIQLSSLCRSSNIAMVTVQTAGVYGRLFCDFGNGFHVLDDGETPLVTLLHTVGVVKEKEEELLEITCVEGERHDVSRGDVIRFEVKPSSYQDDPWERDLVAELTAKVRNVKSPTRFTVSLEQPLSTTGKKTLSELCSVITQHASSITRVKVPVPVPFLSLPDALALAQHRANGSKDTEFNTANKDHPLYTFSDLEKSFDESRRHSLMSCFHAHDPLSHPTQTQTPLETISACQLYGNKPINPTIAQNFAACAREAFVVQNVKSPTKFTVSLKQSLSTTGKETLAELCNVINQHASSITRVKVPVPVPFLSLPDALTLAQQRANNVKGADSHPNHPLYTFSDLEKSFDESRRHSLMSCFHAHNAHLPHHQTQTPLEIISACQLYGNKPINPTIAQKFVACAREKFVPLQAFLGALASQECLKAVSGLYHPVHQFLLYDCDEILDLL
eukprot:CAMPEP_0194445150 /NCGR_PEP_ID=MMETSP0176-20130528/127696_1 /TAXON_ID=216777 /ORGANISM="Proboscia alata, Strain PI-D3" /LENGTH=663 /DNA_ID=CAMNT_0039271663 /DNA_START=123 /DNA_END=2111 /DNA_ORIENTATION=+